MALTTNTDTSVFPYNDNDMVYDLDLRQYLLTVSGIKNLLGYDIETDMGSTELANYFCIEISDIIYNHIYSYTRVRQVDYKRYMIAKDEDLREIFKRILLAQTRYAIKSGANLLGDMHGVNIERSKAININQLRGAIEISSQAQKMLTQTGLLYTGYQYISDITDDGTF